jgi:hypothetical protein
MLDNRGDIVMGRIDLLGNPNNLVGNLSLTVVEKSPQTLRHTPLLYFQSDKPFALLMAIHFI